MIKFSKEEFIEEITAELYGYEDITQEHREVFLTRLDAYIEDQKGKNKRISNQANSITIKMEDETELFGLIDKYLVAIVHDELEDYWKDWKL